MKIRNWNYRTVITWIIRGILVVEFVVSILIGIFDHNAGSFINAFTAILALGFTFIPAAISERTGSKMRLAPTLQFVIVLFIFGAMCLGEIENFYALFSWWDVMLHALSGVILGLIGFQLVYALNESKRIAVELSPLFIALFAFTFALAAGALWEIFEFSGDRLLGMDMQKFRPTGDPSWRYDAGLVDTMGDIICDALSALGTSIFGYFALRKDKRWIERSQKKEAGKPTMEPKDK